MNIDLKIYQEAFSSMPLGLIIVDQDGHILAWNPWMKSKTHLKEDAVFGKTLKSIYPDETYNRFDWACQQVFDFGAPQVLSQILNQYLIPIPLEKDKYENLTMMQQHVEILPLQRENGWFALVVIQDVTSMVHQKNVLMQMGHKLEEESYHDALTGIYNRRFLWEYLDQQIEQAKRDKNMIACIMLDLDHFKRVNDDYGHDAGDKVLLTFVSLIRCIMRSSDVFVRYGGEEFILLMPSANSMSAEQLSERIRSSLENETISIIGNRSVTCSIGISFWSYKAPTSAKGLVDQADKALYQAKHSGRNCLKTYSIIDN